MTHHDDGTLHAYLDGELDERAERSLNEHMADCGSCSARFETAVRERALASNLIAALDAPSIGVPDWDRLVARAGAMEEGADDAPAQRPTRWLPGLAWAATLLLAFTLGWQASRSWLPTSADTILEPSATVPEHAGAPAPVEDLQKRLVETAAADEAPADVASSDAARPVTPSAGTEEAPASAGPAKLAERPAPRVRDSGRESAPPQAGEWEVREADERDDRDRRAERRFAPDERAALAPAVPGIEPWVRVELDALAGWLEDEPLRLGDTTALRAEVTVGPVLVELDTVAVRLTYQIEGQEVTLIEQSTRLFVDDARLPDRSPIDGMPFVRAPDVPIPARDAIQFPPGPDQADYSVLGDGRGALRFVIRASVVELRARLPEATLRALALEVR